MTVPCDYCGSPAGTDPHAVLDDGRRRRCRGPRRARIVDALCREADALLEARARRRVVRMGPRPDYSLVTVTLPDGRDVDVYGVRLPTRATLHDPGDPWAWVRTDPADVDDDEIVEALEVWRG